MACHTINIVIFPGREGMGAFICSVKLSFPLLGQHAKAPLRPDSSVPFPSIHTHVTVPPAVREPLPALTDTQAVKRVRFGDFALISQSSYRSIILQDHLRDIELPFCLEQFNKNLYLML